MDNNLTDIWVFHGANGRFASGIFTQKNNAEQWILSLRLTGILTKYPLNEGVYDWAIKNGFFEITKDNQKEPQFIQGFTTSSQEHYHYKDGVTDKE